jgi:hypothetical protein
MSIPQRIALLTLSTDGGVWTVTRFLWERRQASDRYELALVLSAILAGNPISVRLPHPVTWFRKFKVRELGAWDEGAGIRARCFSMYRVPQDD